MPLEEFAIFFTAHGWPARRKLLIEPISEDIGHKRNGMTIIKKRYAPVIYGIIQAAVTTAVATAIATYQVMGLGMPFVERWLLSWSLAWLTMLPVVVIVAPAIQRAVIAMTMNGSKPDQS